MKTKNRGHYSLRRRLMTAMGVGFALLLVIISIFLIGFTRNAANKSYDLLLAGAALSILEKVSYADDEITIDLPHSALDILSLAPQDRVFYSLTTQDGDLLTGDKNLARLHLEEQGNAPAFGDEMFMDARVRVVQQSRNIITPDARRWVTITIAQTTIARDAHAFSLFIAGLTGVAIISLIGLGFVWLAIGKALQPLAKIESNLSKREPTDLTELSLQPPREVVGLINAINGFMARLEQARQQSEAFMADVAHQTRTSLSALQGHLTLAADAKDQTQMRRRLNRAADQAGRATRLTNQLLSHAMVIHRAENQAMTAFDIKKLVRDLISDMLRDTSLRKINLTLDDEAISADKALIVGDQISINEALKNLIENAIRHGPEKNSITLRLTRPNQDQIAIEVEDEGPGIPIEHREAVLERFKSLDMSGNGSGLGLAIVKEVADAHKAKLQLRNGAKGGLLARLTFEAQKIATVLLFALFGLFGLAQPDSAYADPRTLEIWGATDKSAFQPVVDAFMAANPGVQVEYTEILTVDLYQRVLNKDPATPDIVMSSAMDLQVDLVNKGFAQAMPAHVLPNLQSWAAWRSELFGYTFEPAAVIYHKPTFNGIDLPETHAEMANFIRDNEDQLRGKIGYYDIRTSGAGYLLATQEARLSQQFFRIAESLGRAGVRVFCCTGTMIDATASGELKMSINVIGSYALNAVSDKPNLGVHFFDDFNPVMSRTVFVTKAADNREWARNFVQFLLSDAGQSVISEKSGLLPISETYLRTNEASAENVLSIDSGRFVPIRLSIGLLTYLDQMKREKFLESWQEAVQDIN
ncbi:two-component system sensor histidine kinase TctE [Maritalea mobilis]|uniref:histidine kinase n=1 Tax=Maritalea mobilis TaxID=483324 RepID=A0A4R6VWB3_9HYPH|nr:extracellular solute-binding protein [Maritalea mobilis]TDQ67116.1 two-component system sensor histidine kinase TctE [Maritalea mobilis]